MSPSSATARVTIKIGLIIPHLYGSQAAEGKD